MVSGNSKDQSYYVDASHYLLKSSCLYLKFGNSQESKAPTGLAHAANQRIFGREYEMRNASFLRFSYFYHR